MIRNKWDQRIQRADDLARAHDFAAEVMHFYKHLAALQKSLYSFFEAAIDPSAQKHAVNLRNEGPNLPLLLLKSPEFLSQVETFATQPFVEAARRLRADGEARWREGLDSAWQNATDFAPESPEAVLAWIFLQPYAESLAGQAGASAWERGLGGLSVVLRQASGWSLAARRGRRQTLSDLLAVFH